MFIREIKKRFSKGNIKYEYSQYRLVESVRTERGPRQHTLLNLGTLSIPAEQLKVLANLIEQNLVHTQEALPLFGEAPQELVGLARHFADVIIAKRLKVSDKSQDGALQPAPEARLTGNNETIDTQATPDKPEPVYETIDTNSIITSDSRTIGVEHIALTQLKELGFFTILQKCSFTEKELKVAAAQICARMAHPASERETARWLRSSSALAELLDADFGHISDQTLHRISDKLATHKDLIEKCLSQNTDDLFDLDNRLILYDLTNTYFESPKRSSKIANYGKSKEKRTDCPLITLALVVDGRGFPKRSRILEGNVSEPDTLWDTLEKLEMADSSDDHPRTVVIDAGFATEENLEKLRADKRFEYVAISRKRKFEQDIFADATAQTLQISHKKELLVTTAKHGDETFLLCKSPDRVHKDAAIHTLRKERFEKNLKLLNESLRKPRTNKNPGSIHERIGRLKERYKIGHFYTIEVNIADGNAHDITWKYNAGKEKEFGEYIIRTSRNELIDTDISLIHRTLTMIESAFEWLKSDLGLRPNFHQKDDRMASHASISVLAYFVLAPILNKLEWGGKFVSYCGKKDDHDPWDKPFGWKGVVRTMSSQTRVTTSFKCKDGSRMDARTTVEPTAEQMDIYKRLKVNPRPLKRIINKH
jgi:transposase